MAAIAGVVALGSLAALAIVAGRPAPDRPTIRVSLPFPGAGRLTSINTTVFDVDRTGSRIVYMGLERANEGLWIRDLNALAPRLLAGTAGGTAPFFSPDGRSIAFVSTPATGASVTTGQLRVMSVEGGAPITLVKDSVNRIGGDWGDDGYIYFPHDDGRIARVPAGGGDVQIMSRLEPGSGARHRFPQLLPGGTQLLVHVRTEDAERDHIAILDLRSGNMRELIRAFSGRFLSSGHIVFADPDGGLFAVPFDPSEGAVTGPRWALGDAALVIGGNLVRFTVSPSGVLLYQPAAAGNDQLVWVDRNGTASPIDSTWRGQMRAPALSPDGSRLAVSLRDGSQTRIWVKQLPNGPHSVLSSTDRENWRPRWAPDSRRIAYLAGSSPSDLRVVARRFDGSDAGEVLIKESGALSEFEWEPNGRGLMLRRGSLLGTRDILRFTPGTDSAPKVVLAEPHDEFGPTISPNGRWFAYISTESGRPEIFVRRTDDPSGERTQVSSEGASNPVWGRSGRELFWRGRDGGTMFVADVQTGAMFSSGTPRILFDRREYMWDFFSRAFDISLDDRRFLMVSTEGSDNDEMVLVFNLDAELRARAGRRTP